MLKFKIKYWKLLINHKFIQNAYLILIFGNINSDKFLLKSGEIQFTVRVNPEPEQGFEIPELRNFDTLTQTFKHGNFYMIFYLIKV